MHSTQTQEQTQHSTPNYLIQKRRSLQPHFNRCPKAQTLLGYLPDRDSYVIGELPCQNWSCRPCAERKIRRLAAKTRDAKPTRMLTLTVNPAKWQTPREAFDGTRRQVPELLRRLRARFGEIEYLRVTELTRQGWPHYHLLLRSDYIPHAVVKKAWNELTGAYIVDLRQVDKTFRAYTYLVKYLSKLHKIEWTERHVSYSKNFFPPESPPPASDVAMERPSILPFHPITYLMQHHQGDFIQPLTNTLYLIVDWHRDDEF